MSGFDHYIITLYNATFKSIFTSQHRGSQSWGSYFDIKAANKRLDPSWLAYRAGIFNTFTQPSILAQTNKNFQWLILFDELTSSSYISALNKYNRFLPLLVNSDNLLSVVQKQINLTSKTEWTLSTNLDSDDALSINFIEELHKSINFKSRIIMPNKGVRVRIPENISINVNSKTNSINHFHSIFEKKDKELNCISKAHGAFKGLLPLRILKDARWLEVIHGDNLSNKLKLKSNDQFKQFNTTSINFGLDPNNFICDIPTNKKGNISQEVFEQYLQRGINDKLY